MKNRLFLCFSFTFLCMSFSAFSQEDITAGETSNVDSDLTASSEDASRNIMIARSSADYRVTQGDVYTLAYAAGATPVTYIITVDSSYRIRVSNLGIVNGAGKTFMQLKTEVESIVANNYPLSGVQLVLTQPAIFKVFVNGEVRSAAEVSTWALNRLSSLTGRNLTAYASIRDISVKSAGGQTQIYDLFKARRLGDLTQDPYLRPGDVVTFNRIERVVRISGAVERPGMYQLVDGENLSELINFYGGGFTEIADNTRIEMVRMINSEDISGNKIFFTEEDLANNYTLENYDAIAVPAITQLQPVMFVEGAVRTGAIDEAQLTSSNRIVVRFNTGETYASMIRRNIRWFSEISDTQNAYILRDNESIPINLNQALYDASFRGTVFVQENDILIIPFRQYFITVSGAVINPGRYPYIPDRDWEYYIGLAGGFLPERNLRDVITIVDISGKRLRKTDVISPETTITASANHFLYYFNQVAPVATTLLGFVTTIFTILMYTR